MPKIFILIILNRRPNNYVKEETHKKISKGRDPK